MTTLSTTSCSQCGQTFGPGAHSYSHCSQHPPYADIVDAKIAEISPAGSRYDYDTLDRETAIRALAGGHACLLTRASYHNVAALSAANAVNEGELLVGWLKSAYASRRYGNGSLTWFANTVLVYLIAVNPAGAAVIEEAKAFCAKEASP